MSSIFDWRDSPQDDPPSEETATPQPPVPQPTQVVETVVPQPKEPEKPKVPTVILEYPSAREFILLMQAVKVLVDEAVWTMGYEGLSVKAMDPSHVAMIELRVPRTMWEELEASVEAWHTGVNAAQVLRALPKPKKDEDSLRLETVPDRDRLRWTVRSGSLKRTVQFDLLDLTPEEIPVVRIDFKAKVRLTVEALKTIIEDACKTSENIRLEADGEKARFTATGDQEYGVTLDKYTEELLSLEVREPTKAVYSLGYLKGIVDAASKLSETISLSWANSMPLRLDVELPQTQLAYYVAPWIE